MVIDENTLAGLVTMLIGYIIIFIVMGVGIRRNSIDISEYQSYDEDEEDEEEEEEEEL